MILFKKKDSDKRPKGSLRSIMHERVLTAEGWHRSMEKKEAIDPKTKKKGK